MDEQLTIPKRRRPLVILPRDRRVEQVAELDKRLGRRALNREIRDELGISLSYASGLRTDPTGEIDRERKRSYYRPCESCGDPCYSSGPNGTVQSRTCVTCTEKVDRPARREGPPRKRGWLKPDLLDAIVAFTLELGRLPSTGDLNPTVPGVRPTPGPYYRVWPTTRRRWNESWILTPDTAGGPTGALVEAVRQDRIPVEIILNERNQTRRQLMTEAYGFERLIHRAGELLDESDYGTLYRLDLWAGRRTEIREKAIAYMAERKNRREGDLEARIASELRWASLPEPVVMVKVVNSSPEPDGTFKDYWLRVPPTIATAREAVAWTFDVPADEYRVAIET